MTDKCTEVRDVLALEGKVPENVHEHLENCVLCAAFLKNLSAVEAELGSLPTADVDDDVVTELLARKELKVPAPARGNRYWAMGLAAAAVIGFVAVRISVHDQGSVAPSVDFKVFRQEEIRVPMGAQGGVGGDGVTARENHASVDAEGEAFDFEARRQLESLGYLADKDAADKVERAPKKQDAQSLLVPAPPPPPPLPALSPLAGASEEGKESSLANEVPKGAFYRAPVEIPNEAGALAADEFRASDLRSVGQQKRRSIEKLVHVDPVLPAIARRARIRGTVRL